MQLNWREWLRPEARHYDSGVPVETTVDGMVTAVQPLFGLAIIIMCVITVDPLGVTGAGLFGSLLLIVNSLIMLSRNVPDRLIGDRTRLAIATVGAITAGLLFGFDPVSWETAFSIIICVHAGIRFEAPIAVGVALLVGVTAMTTLAIRHDTAHSVPWWTGATVMLGVLIGILRRSRNQSLRAAHELVVQTQRTTESESRAQALAERARVARDIHDVLAHSLSGVNMQLSMADALFGAGRTEQARQAVRRAQGMVVEGLGEARRAVQTLRNETIELVPTLQKMLVADHERFEISGTPTDLDTPRSQTIVRTAQEALTNARRHAAGAETVVALHYQADAVVLEVTNAPSTAGPSDVGGGHGLVGMRERVALIDAELTVGPITSGAVSAFSAFRGGWQVRLTVPRPRTDPTNEEKR